MGSKEEGGKEEEEKKKKNSGSSAKLPNGFDCRCYLNRYADLQRAFGTNCERAKAHYIKHGRKEKRKYKCSEQRPSPTPSCDSKTANKCYCNREYKGEIAFTHHVKPICDDHEGNHANSDYLGYDCHDHYAPLKEFVNMNYA